MRAPTGAPVRRRTNALEAPSVGIELERFVRVGF